MGSPLTKSWIKFQTVRKNSCLTFGGVDRLFALTIYLISLEFEIRTQTQLHEALERSLTAGFAQNLENKQ